MLLFRTPENVSHLEAAENRNYLMQRVKNEVNEIVRVIQLSTDNDLNYFSETIDDLSVVKRALRSIEILIESTLIWLNNCYMLPGAEGAYT